MAASNRKFCPETLKAHFEAQLIRVIFYMPVLHFIFVFNNYKLCAETVLYHNLLPKFLRR